LKKNNASAGARPSFAGASALRAGVWYESALIKVKFTWLHGGLNSESEMLSEL
jgi:hypothetical protein